MNPRTIGVVLGVLLLAGAGQAQEPKKPPVPPVLQKLLAGTPEEFIERFDQNKDRKLSKEEVPPFLAPTFERADRDGSGALDQPEVAALIQVLRTRGGAVGDGKFVIDKILKQFDTNQDEKISRAEAKGRIAETFDKLDVNRDGNLDRKELQSVVQRSMKKPFGPGFGAPGAGAGMDFDSLDRNADGRLTREELKGTPLLSRFGEIDADRSGMLDRREFENAVKGASKKE